MYLTCFFFFIFGGALSAVGDGLICNPSAPAQSKHTFQFLYFLPVGLSFLDCVETSDVLLARRIVKVINSSKEFYFCLIIINTCGIWG